jgi:hypothetical protein
MLEITDEKIKRTIIFLFKNLYSGKYSHFFPQQICEYIQRKDLFKLKSFSYYYYKKNTKKEKKAVLFLFIDSKCDQKAVLILKDFSMYLLDIDCHYEYYKNSLFDVSLYEDKIIIYDTIYISGFKINNYEFIERINEAENFKKCTNSQKIEICDYHKEVSELNDSLIPYEEEIFIISNNFPFIVGINKGCFKWHPMEQTYLSLKVCENAEDLILYATNYKKEVVFSKIHYSDLHGKNYIDEIKSLENYKNECVIDICFVKNENNCNEDNCNENNCNENNCNEKIKILRISKNYPSSITYIEKLLQYKKENISIHELK